MTRKGLNKAGQNPWMLMLSGWTLVAPGALSMARGEAPGGAFLVAAGAAIIAWAVAGLKVAGPSGGR